MHETSFIRWYVLYINFVEGLQNEAEYFATYFQVKKQILMLLL